MHALTESTCNTPTHLHQKRPDGILVAKVFAVSQQHLVVAGTDVRKHCRRVERVNLSHVYRKQQRTLTKGLFSHVLFAVCQRKERTNNTQPTNPPTNQQPTTNESAKSD